MHNVVRGCTEILPRLKMVLRASAVSKKNFKEADFAKKNYAI